MIFAVTIDDKERLLHENEAFRQIVSKACLVGDLIYFEPSREGDRGDLLTEQAELYLEIKRALSGEDIIFRVFPIGGPTNDLIMTHSTCFDNLTPVEWLASQRDL